MPPTCLCSFARGQRRSSHGEARSKLISMCVHCKEEVHEDFSSLCSSFFFFFSLSTGLRVTSLRRRGVISSMFSSKSSAPCFQATLAKWTKLLCWKKSLAFCRNTMVRVTAARHALAKRHYNIVFFSDYQNGSRGLKVPM